MCVWMCGCGGKWREQTVHMLSFDKFKVWDAMGVWCSGVVWFGEEWRSGVGVCCNSIAAFPFQQ